MKQTLSSCKKNQTFVVEHYETLPPVLQRRLGSFGIYPKCELNIKHISILKQTILVQVGLNFYALSKQIAKQIWVRGQI